MIDALIAMAEAYLPLMIAAAFTAWAVSRWLDYMAYGSHRGFKRNVLPVIGNSPLSLSLYHGLRWIGICYLVASLFGAVRF